MWFHLAPALDVIGQNEYVGWYEGKPDDADTMAWTMPNKPILFSDFCARGQVWRSWRQGGTLAEEQQVNVYEHQFKMISKIPQVRGLVPWVLMDFRSSVRNIPKLQDGYNRKGLFSEKGEKKMAFYLFQKTYKERSVGKAE